jgi:hypothetical protein
MSWTLDLKKARWFATRLYQPDPIVLQATILKPDVLAYFDERKERELVVRPGRVRALRTIEVTPKTD